MSIVSAVLLASVLSTAATPAPPGGIEPAFGNTVVSTYPDGRTARAWMDPNGTYVGLGRRGGRSSGRWTLKDDRICMRQSKPFPFPKSYCTAVPKGGVGTSWPGKAVTGEAVTMTLVAGQAGR